MIIFISGGVRSGKSQYAEQRACQLFKQEKRQLAYIATSNVYDEEMHLRVMKHQLQRARTEVNWNLYEQTSNIERLLPLFHEGDVILLDCLTTLLSNELFDGWQMNEPKWKSTTFVKEIEMKIIRLFTIMSKSSYSVFIVSNEVSYDLSIKEQGTKVFIKSLGRIHQKIVSLAAEAILVENGIAHIKKGEKSCDWNHDTRNIL